MTGLKEKLDRVLNDRNALRRSARYTFQHFDRNGDGELCLLELRRCIDSLVRNMELPPVDDETVYKLMQRYDIDENGARLSQAEFAMLYESILSNVRAKYYQDRKLCLDRQQMVSHKQLKRDEQFWSFFSKVRRLGSGSFGEVFLVKDNTSQLERVCKVIDKKTSSCPLLQIYAEVEIMKRVDHPSVIKIFEVFEDSQYMYIIMETCLGGELLAYILDGEKKGKRFSEAQVAKIMKQVLEAVAYCHSQNIIHKDLKPENIMLHTPDNFDTVKVIDFGVAETFASGKYIFPAGTALYMAPEVFNRRCGLKADVWSSGVILYVLLTGMLPFFGSSTEELSKKIQKYEPNYAVDCRVVSRQGRDLLRRMLSKSVHDRPSAKECLEHDWFRQVKCETAVLDCDLDSNLQKYMRGNELKGLVYNVMSHEMNVTGPEIRKLSKLFRSMDTNKDGVLSRDEVASCLSRAGWSSRDIDRLVNAIDTSGEGAIGYTELVAACMDWSESYLNLVWGTFQKLDSNGDGVISAEDFRTLLTGKNGGAISERDIRRMLKEVDPTNTGVTWDNFKKWILC
ncbi:MAG: uncharacterized protein KVP18_003818 [Porospora cf. gigantea A]|uniref:uncharacterized protein n=1 Tax=Porospora cf. gigantea A TaxID=2853593 RepID=UPI003559CB35|nr:MAG: hypothetical protein KVP18_003818 [Porospora cf. gigantea A]